MGKNRLFVSQARMDEWLSEGRVEVDGEQMTTLPEKRRFQLRTAVLFKQEVAGGGDEQSLVGRVKDVEQITELGGDYSAGSVILGDNAYEVLEGFAGEPLADASTDGDTLGDAMLRATGEGPAEGEPEIDLLARLFLEKRG